MDAKIRNFTDLITWQEAHKLAILIYKITDDFPKKEIFSLVNQIRRCAVSITSNIAEGFSRQGRKEKTQFYYIAKGSLTELYNQIILSKDVGYLDKEIFNTLEEKINLIGKLLTGLIKSQKF